MDVVAMMSEDIRRKQDVMIEIELLLNFRSVVGKPENILRNFSIGWMNSGGSRPATTSIWKSDALILWRFTIP